MEALRSDRVWPHGLYGGGNVDDVGLPYENLEKSLLSLNHS